MFNQLFPSIDRQYKYKSLNIIIVESDRPHREFLAKAISSSRPHHHIMAVDDIEEIFSLMYGEVAIDLILFDIESMLDANNIAIINAISPEISFIHCSDCQHPEVIELLYGLGVNSFCLKNSTYETLTMAMDSIATNPKILYLDEHLNQCLPLLAN